MSWTEQDLRAVLRDQVAVVPPAPGRASAVQAGIVRRQRRARAATAAALLLVVVALAAGMRALPFDRSMPPAGPRVGDGTILFSDTSGDIRVLDPVTGVSSSVIAGGHAAAPTRTPDGTHILFLRTDESMFYVANLDGTGARPFAPASDLDNWDFSPRGDRIAAVAADGTLSITDADHGHRRAIPLPQKVDEVWWTGDDTLLLYAGNGEVATTAMWTINADGTGQKPLRAPDGCCGTAVQKGTARIAWTSWDSSRPSEGEGRIHVRDLSTDRDVLLASTQVYGSLFLDPQFSPDGRWLAVQMFPAGGSGKRLALIAADGSGSAIPLGPSQARNDSGIRVIFSPDSSKVLALYADDGSAWLFDVASGTGARTPWPGLVEADWLG